LNERKVMDSFLSDRLSGLVQSDIRRMTRECLKVGGINLGQGLGDMPAPSWVTEGAKAGIDSGKAQYTYPEGTVELREAIATKLARDNQIQADPESQICVTVGTSGAFTCVLNALLNPGDGILIMEPYYGYHLNASILCGMKPQFLTLRAPDFELFEDALRESIDDTTRAIVLCSPSNPSGKIFSSVELERIARVANEKDLLIISDEIYEYIIYDDCKHISPSSLASLQNRTVSLMGFSKTFSITGWRLGYVVGPPELIKPVTLVNDLLMVCAPAPLQHGVTEGLKAPPSYYQSLAAGYQSKRDLICKALADAQFPPIIPSGAYYVLADVSRLGYPKAIDAAMALLTEDKVAAVPGSAFFRGVEGEGLLRFCYAKDQSLLEEACDRITSFGNKH